MSNPTITPSLANSVYTRTEQNGSSQITLAPKPFYSTYPGDWSVTGDPWTADGDNLSLDNPFGNDDYLYSTLAIAQTGVAPVVMRAKVSGRNIDASAGSGYSLQVLLTDSGGMSGTVLANEIEDLPPGTWPEQQYSVSATSVALADPSAVLTLSQTANAGSTLAVGPWYLDFAYTNLSGATKPGTSESSITLTTASAYEIQFSVNLPQDQGCTGIIVGMGSSAGTEAQFAKIDPAAAVTYIGTNSAGVTASVAGSVLTVTITAAPTDTSTSMPSSNTAAAYPAHYAYCWLFAHGVGGLTVRDMEVYSSTQAGVTTATYGEWWSAPTDVPKQVGTAIASGTLRLKTVLLDYGDLANVDGTASVQHGIDRCSQFAMLIVAEPGVLSSRALQVVKGAIAAGVQVYGYDQVGYAAGHPAPSLTDMKAIVDRCALQGYAGIFGDMWGYDYSVSRATQNALVDYAHSRDLMVIANAWNPEDALGYRTDATYNPSGVLPHLGPGDYWCAESFYSRDDDEYAGVPEGGIAYVVQKYQLGVRLAAALGASTLALAYAFTTTPLTSDTDMLNSYLLAASLGMDAWTYGDTTTSSSDDISWPPEDLVLPQLGSQLVSALQNADPYDSTYEATTDQGVIWFTAVDSPVSRSAGSYSTASQVAGFTAGSLPAIDPSVARTTTYWETSDDLQTWTQIQPGSNPPKRWLRYHVVLRNA